MKAGFQGDVESQLVKNARLKSLKVWEKFVIIVFDEMKIKEGLVFDKYNDQLVGFVTLDDVSNCLMDLERKCLSSALAVTIATRMLVLMVRGVTIHLCFLFAQFPTDDITAYQLYSLVTDAILRLEMLGFKVISMTCNGTLPNCKLCKILSSNLTSSDSGVPYKMLNPYTDENRDLCLISDVPHLLKMTRNCWANSYAHSCSCRLWVSVYVCVCVCVCVCMCVHVYVL